MAKILNVISAVSPCGGTINKLRAIMTLSTQNKHFIYHPGFKTNEELIKKEIPWYKEHGINAYFGIYDRNIFKNAREITKIIKENKIDIVHFYFNHEQSFAWLIKLFNPKIILVRSIVGYDKKLSFWKQFIVNIAFHTVPNYVYISKYIKSLYEKDYHCLKNKNTRIIYNGPINVKEIHNPIAKRKLIVSVGGLCERKNLMVLIEAMNIIVNIHKRKDLQLYLIGEGPDRKLIEQNITKYSLENNVQLLGYKDNVSKYLDECTVYVHPAITEGFGIAVVEAMQMECPCIVADKGALPELIVNNECGFVVPAFNADIWANKILYLYDNIPERERMGKNAYNRAEKDFSLKAFINNHEKLYSDLMK